MTSVKHPFPPVFDEGSRILILGSFPSVKSREINFYYGHPQNRFWRMLAALYGCDISASTEERKCFLLSRGIALSDVIASCEIEGSSDSSIKNVIPNDLSPILKMAKIEKIFVNGKTAKKYYDKYQKNTVGIEAVCLPSTSPANAACSFERLCEEWSAIVNQN